MEWGIGMSTGCAQEMQKGWARFLEWKGGDDSSEALNGPRRSRRIRPGLRVSWSEPRQEAMLEFFGSCAESAAVVGGGNLPELGVGSVGVDAEGVAKGNVAVELAMNQKNRCRGCRCGIFWR